MQHWVHSEQEQVVWPVELRNYFFSCQHRWNISQGVRRSVNIPPVPDRDLSQLHNAAQQETLRRVTSQPALFLFAQLNQPRWHDEINRLLKVDGCHPRRPYLRTRSLWCWSCCKSDLQCWFTLLCPLASISGRGPCVYCSAGTGNHCMACTASKCCL